MISGADEDGRVMVEFSEPVGGRRVKMLTPDEINGMLYKEETSESPANAEEAMAEETEPPTAGQEESGESALERIPKDAQTGEPQYTQTDAPTAWDAIVEQTEGDEDMARSVVDSTVRDKEAALKKLESSNPKPGATVAEKIAAAKEHKAAIEAARQELEQWKAIAEVENRRKAEVEAKVKAAEEEAKAKAKAKAKAEEEEKTDESEVSQGISLAGKVSESPETKQEKAEKSISAKVKEASADVNTEPTEAQKEAGNYKKGHVQVGMFDITIEQPEGSIRRGTDADGKQWESKMHNTYGYFRGTEGVDGDHIDVFLSNDIDGWNGRKVYVVDQYNPDGTFDEHKVMLGFNDMDEAKGDYLANYEKGWENGRRIDVSAVNLEDFEKWIASSHRKTKPFSEYKSVKPADDSETFKGHKAENSGKDTEAQIKHLEEIKDYPGADKKIVQSEIDRLKAKEEAKAKSKSEEVKSKSKEVKPKSEEVKSKSEEVKSKSKEVKPKSEEVKSKSEEAKSKSEEAKSKSEEVKSKSKEVKSKSEEKNGVDDAKIDTVLEALSKGDEKAVRQLASKLTNKELSKARSKAKPSFLLEYEWQWRAQNRGDVSLHDWMLENQYVEPAKRVSGTFKMTDYIAPKDSPYAERIGGVYHDKSGFAVATDGRILVADKGSYDPKLKGKIIGKDGVAMENKFPDWQEAISTAKETKSSLIDVEDLHRFVAGVLRANKRAYISLRFPDGTVGVFKANRLNLMLRAIKQLGTSELLYTKDGMILVAKSEKGTAMLMGLVSVEDELVEANGYAYPGNTVSYHRGEVVSEMSQEERVLRDAVIDRLRESGMEVITDEEAGQRVLDEANGKVRQMSFGEPYDYAAYPYGRVEPNLAEKDVNVVAADANHGFNNYKEAKTWAKQNVSKSYNDKETGGKGNVRISNAAIDKFLSQSAVDKSDSKDVHMAVLKVLPGLLKTSIDVETHPDFIKGEDGKRNAENGINKDVLVHRCYGAVSLDGKLYRVKITLKEDPRDLSFPHVTHSYEATKIELLAGTWENRKSPSPNTRNSITAAKLLENVGMSYNPGEKVLAASEKRSANIREQRVYHGSGADFDRFDHSHIGEGEGNQAFGWGTYVTEVEGIGRTYAEQNAQDVSPTEEDFEMMNAAISEKVLERFGGIDTELRVDYDGDGGFNLLDVPNNKEVLVKFRKYFENHPDEFDGYIEDYDLDDEYGRRDFADAVSASMLDFARKVAEDYKDKYLPTKQRILYTVDIPDDNGRNYLDWNGHPAESLLKDVSSFLESNGFERVQDSPARYEKGESTVVLNPNATGADLYAELQEALGSDKKASQTLAELGYIGIKYPADYMRGGREDGKKNYVIFDEKDAKITDRVRFFRTAKGEAYGFTVGGKIYIDPKIANTETSIHEYAHLWAAALRGQNPKEWQNIVELMKGTSVWDEVKKRYPELNTDDDIADEVLATYSGRRGAERLREEQRKIAGDKGGVFEKAEAISALERVKQALRKFWKSVADFLHIHYKSAEEVADRVMKDLLDGVDPRKHFNSRNDDPRFMFAGEKGAARADRGEEALTRQNNLGVAQKMEAAKKEAKAIKLATGWERGADGKWRYEIPDGIYHPKGDAELKKALARQPWREELNGLSDRILDGEGLSKEETERFNELAEKEAAFKADYLKKEKPHLADWLENDELFKAYPELKRVGIVFTDNMPKEQAGYYDSKSNTITVNTNSSEDTASIIAHEVQHAIQRYEGFATGGNLKAAMEYLSGNKRADVKIKQQLAYKLSQEKGLGLSEEEVNSLIGHLEYEDISDDELQKQIDALCQKHNITEDQLEDIYPMDSVWHEAYNRISGEAEARNVQKRMGMTAEERRVSLAADTEDVARDSQILLFSDTGKNMSLESPKEDDIRYRTGEKKELRDGRKIEFVRKPTATYNALARHLQAEGINPDMHEAHTGSRYMSFEKDGVQWEVRSSDHTKPEYYGEAQKPVELTYYKDKQGEENLSVSVDLGTSGYNIEDMKALMAEIDRLKNDAGEVKESFDKGVVSDEAAKRYPLLSQALGVKSENEVRAKEEAQEHAEEARKHAEEARKQEMRSAVEDMAGRLHLNNVDIVDKPAGRGAGRRERAKGMFERSTGRITINIGNCADKRDAVVTLQHEAVAHHGLRKLFGENFETFLDNVYNSANAEIRRIIDKHSHRYDGDKRTATEEYMASLAERTDFENAKKSGWWQRIKDFFLKMLEKIGLKGFKGEDLSDNELRYVLWRSYENLKSGGKDTVFSAANDLAKQSELKVGEFAPDAKAEGSVAALNTRFNNELQQQIDGNLPSNHIYQMGNPGKILLSTGVPDLPIQMNAKRLQDRTTLFDHNFELYEVKDLVKALQNPLAVFSYGDKTKAQNIIVPLQKNGKNFIVGLSLNPTVGGKALEINSIRNVFPKDNSEWLNWISQGKALYLDKEKIQTLIAQQRTNLADVEYLDLDSAAKVVENFENPKPESKNDILFRDGDAKDYEKAQARETYERRVSTGMFQSREAIQDSMLSLKVAMDAIEEATAGKAKRIEDYDGFENAYLGENRLSSVNQAESAAFAHLLIRPMMEEVNRLAPTAEERAELVDYMFAKHGLERNAYMRQQAAEKKLAEYKKQNPGTAKTATDFIDAERDYAGLTTLTGEADVSAAEAEAQRMEADYENDYTFHGTWNEIYVCRKKIC